jgi:hypothetical protein
LFASFASNHAQHEKDDANKSEAGADTVRAVPATGFDPPPPPTTTATARRKPSDGAERRRSAVDNAPYARIERTRVDTFHSFTVSVCLRVFVVIVRHSYETEKRRPSDEDKRSR